MFHLFNKVYLNFDHNITHSENRIVVSKNVGQNFSEGDSSIGKSFYQFLSIENFKDEGIENELQFFKKCKEINDSDSKRLTIYCDKTSFQKLFIYWHKLILKNIKVENLWKIWTFYLQKETYLSAMVSQTYSSFANELKEEQWSEDEFISLYNDTIVINDNNFINNLIPQLGIEYILSSYVNDNKTVKRILTEKLLLLAKRSIQQELYELKVNIIMYSQNKSFLDYLNISEVKNIKDIFKHEKTEIFDNNIFWTNSILVPSGSESSIDFSKLNSDYVEKIILDFKYLNRFFRNVPENFMEMKKIEWLRYILNDDITENQIDDIIYDTSFTSNEFSDNEDRRKINVMFTDWVLNCKLSNRMEIISDINLPN